MNRRFRPTPVRTDQEARPRSGRTERWLSAAPMPWRSGLSATSSNSLALCAHRSTGALSTGMPGSRRSHMPRRAICTGGIATRTVWWVCPVFGSEFMSAETSVTLRYPWHRAAGFKPRPRARTQSACSTVPSSRNREGEKDCSCRGARADRLCYRYLRTGLLGKALSGCVVAVACPSWYNPLRHHRP